MAEHDDDGSDRLQRQLVVDVARACVDLEGRGLEEEVRTAQDAWVAGVDPLDSLLAALDRLRESY